MRTLSRWFLVLAVVACIGGAALAQQPGRQPGGFGGMGMGMGMGGGINLKSLVLTNAALQEELKITEAQKAKFLKFTETQAADAEKMRALTSDDEDQITRLKMQIKTIEDRMALMKDLTADQTKRISQIERQILGMRVYSNEKVQAELKLSDGQKEQIKTIVNDYNKESGEITGGGRGGAGGTPGGGRGTPGAGGAPGGGRGTPGAGGAPGGGFGGFGRQVSPENQKKLDALREEAMEKIEKQMNDEQRKAFKDVLGVKFDMAKLMQRRQEN
jgi:small-conductance mechanosensitive channel